MRNVVVEVTFRDAETGSAIRMNTFPADCPFSWDGLQEAIMLDESRCLVGYDFTPQLGEVKPR